MAEDIKVPVIGKVKPVYIIAGLGALGVAMILYFRHADSSASSAADSADIDPATGFPYGSAQDTAALAGSSGLDSGLDGSTGIDPTTGFPAGSQQDLTALEQLYGTTGTTTTVAPTTDAQWAADVQTTLSQIGYTSTSIATALGLYLARQSLTSDQAGIIRVALAEVGPPPVGTYSIKLKGDGTPPAQHGSPNRVLITSGAESLDTIAKQYKNSTAQIIRLTNTRHAPQAKFIAYVAKGKFNDKMPSGIDLYYEG